jgi:hypothetical protein
MLAHELIELEKKEVEIANCLKRRQIKSCSLCCRNYKCEDYLLVKNKKIQKNS